MSEAMRSTPKQRRYAHALRGFWSCFPVSPTPTPNDSLPSSTHAAGFQSISPLGLPVSWTRSWMA